MLDQESLVVKESITGIWYYHLATPGHAHSLCGMPVFEKELPLSLWGYRSHVGEKYCQKCQELKSLGSLAYKVADELARLEQNKENHHD